jgi:hypothetical protein
MARLEQSDWNELTAAANSSARHVSSLDRWRAKAAAANPALSGEQLDRAAEMLKADFYREIGRRSGEARRAAAARRDAEQSRGLVV